MSNWFKPAALAALFALAAPPAHAQPGQDLSGAWTFRAEFAAIGCTITGQAILQPTRRTGRYDVRMNATQTCAGVVDYQVLEACVATQTRAHVSLRCRLEQPVDSYLPDDFELEIAGDGRMQGLLTANWNAPAEWRRLSAANVS